MSDWTFSIRWIDEQHILLSFLKDDTKHEIALPVRNYVELMELAQIFNTRFRNKIDEQVVKHYVKG